MFKSAIGVKAIKEGKEYIVVKRGETGFAAYGPYLRYAPGKYTVEFQIILNSHKKKNQYGNCCRIDVCTNYGTEVLASRDISQIDIMKTTDGFISLEYILSKPSELEFRVYVTGLEDLTIRLGVILHCNQMQLMLSKSLVVDNFSYERDCKMTLQRHLAEIEIHNVKYGTFYDVNDKARCVSSICRPSEHFKFNKWTQLLGYPMTMNRKIWEWAYIVQSLWERDMLENGRKGLGFAVGCEPLPAAFASFDCRITASDVDPQEINGDIAEAWKSTGQHSDEITSLVYEDICALEKFNECVTFKYINMNSISDSIVGYDFCWSSCALEHLGSIESGKQFIYNMLDCLKPGGIAVHTTEFNLSSNVDTITEGPSVIFRESDLEEIIEHLENEGHYVEPLDLRLDGSVSDSIVSFPPYNSELLYKLDLQGFLSTSIGLIIKKKEAC